MLETVNGLLTQINDLVWGLPLIILIMAVGIYLTIRLKLLQIIHLPKALVYMFKNEEGGTGEVSSFAALCTALSATIGTGNIVGVATAIVAGGPGALFWMWIAALFGMATKYAEGFLAIKYRVVKEDGHVLGGPFYYIENGMGVKWKWLAKMFAIFGALAGLLGIGTITQVNGITTAINGFFDPNNTFSIPWFNGGTMSWSVIIGSIVITACAALVIIGGIKRISGVAQIVVPFMAVLYILCSILIMIVNAGKIPAAFSLIFESAFGLRAAAGGALGAMMVAMQKGVARGIFSNESGLGSAPIAAAAAQTKEPVRQGLVSMTGTFIDTVIVCTMTGLSIIITGAWDTGLEGVQVTTLAFQKGLPFQANISSLFLMICLVFFAFTTILGWNYYGERCLEYFTNGNMKKVALYRYLYITAIFIGPFISVSAVWTIADIFNALMAFPNLVALLALSKVITADTKDYFVRMKKIKSS